MLHLIAMLCLKRWDKSSEKKPKQKISTVHKSDMPTTQGATAQGSAAAEDGTMPSAAEKLICKLRNPDDIENALRELCKVTISPLF